MGFFASARPFQTCWPRPKFRTTRPPAPVQDFLPNLRRHPIRAPMLDHTPNRPDLPREIARRRTFAIISHPDAGKTTLTEK
ncbi:MAG: hypothetical protein ACO3VR_06185, partial [Lutimaribacter sp.]